MTHDIAGPDRGAKTGHSGAFGPSWNPDGSWVSPIGTPASETRQRRMQDPEYAQEARTLTVRFTYLRKGHPRAALEAVLRSISPAVFETEILDEKR